jgi:hypothetical protein
MQKIIFLSLFIWLFAQVTSIVNAQALAGTDELGRTLLHNDAVGDPKPGRHVAMFYFLWQGDKGSPTSQKYWDLHEIYTTHPEVFDDCDNPYWGGQKGTYYFWGQPVYGYYRGDDYWVHLRNLQLLTDAGVDLLVIDATNRLIYSTQSEALMKAMDAVRAQGKTPPGIVFYTNTLSGEAIKEIYEQFYMEGAPYRHPGCWFHLDGKPLIIGATKDVKDQRCLDFFTIREAQWPTESQRVNGWPWISFTRKPEVHYNARGEKEIINVSVAQHPNPTAGMGGSAFYGNRNNWGRSYRNNSHGNPETDIFYGYNFQEQWDYALKEDVPFVFVTGWNEWIAGRWDSHDKNPEHSWFCDQASPEYSRDIEPSLTAGLKDHYYMQLVNNIRRYKGVEKTTASGPLLLPVTNLNDWDRMGAVYTDYTGDAQHRNHPGAQSEPATTYTNTTGRNDFHIMKVAHNKENIFFYVKTVNDITPNMGDNWMRLYIDADRNAATGWKGYDYRIVGGATLQRYINGEWKNVNKKAFDHTIEKNKMMIAVPRSFLHLMPTLNFEFKWADNMQAEDPMDWYVNGDTAPGGRFNYVYMEK